MRIINIWCPLFKCSYGLTQRWLQSYRKYVTRQIKLFQNEEVEKDRKVQQEGILPATAVLCTYIFYQRHRHGMACQGMMKETILGCHQPSKNSKLRHGHVKA
jgi:hypothetical protein